MEYRQRISRLQAKLKRKKLDALLVSKPENRRYLCGYAGGDHGIAESSGILIVPSAGDTIYLITDFRFQQQAKREAPMAEVIISSTGNLDVLSQLLPDTGVRKLGFESHYTLHSYALKLTEVLKKKDIQALPVTDVIEAMRCIKEESEIEALRRSVRLNESVFTEINDRLDSFSTEIEVALAIEAAMRKKGAEGPSFSTIVASGENSALPHAVPSSSRLVEDSPLTIDMGLILDGYCSDMTRNQCLGKADNRYRELHRLVRRAQLAGIAAIRAGVTCCDVDRAARKVIADGGYGQYFGHSLGHGVGLAVHEAPRLSARSRRKLQAGMIVTVEPGIYLPGWGGIRLENMVVVGKDGCENLNTDVTWLDI